MSGLSQFGSGQPHGYTVITVSGTWTVPSGVYLINTVLLGGGGPGNRGSNNFSGCSGQITGGQLFVTPGQVLTITLGAGGQFQVDVGNGANRGGKTTIGIGSRAVMYADGGSNYNLTSPATQSSTSIQLLASTFVGWGNGGSAGAQGASVANVAVGAFQQYCTLISGVGGAAAPNSASNAGNATGYGAGGGSCYTADTTHTPGNGAPGAALIWY